MSKPPRDSNSPDPPGGPIGLIGLGLLGGALADRLIAGGFEVVGFDSNPAARSRLEARGGRVASGVAQVALDCGRVVVSLPDHPVASEVLRSSPPRAGSIVIDTTTGDPSGSEELSAWLGRSGVAYLDATVSGSSELTRAGEAIVMVGGDRGAFDRCLDLFDRIAQRTFFTGPSGSGARMKLVTNLVLGLNRAALAEGLAFGESLGFDASAVLEILLASPAYSRIMDAKGPKMVARDYTPQARLSQHLKDVRLMQGEARRARASLPLTDAHARLLESAERLGWGDRDNSALIEALRPDPNGTAHD